MKVKTRTLHRGDAENAEKMNSLLLCDLGVSAVNNPK